MNKKNTHQSLYALIHDEEYRQQHEAMVFRIANTVAVHFNIRGDGHTLHALLDRKDDSNDAQVLVTWISEILLNQQRRQMAQVAQGVIHQLEQAFLAKGVLTWDR